MTKLTPRLLALLLTTSLHAADFSVREHGAMGDGATLDTVALQRAIEACGKAGGGRVVFPPGKYLSGTLYMRTGVELHLEREARLIGTTDLAAYAGFSPGSKKLDLPTSRRDRALIIGEQVNGIAFTGEGVIDGNKVFDAEGEEKMRGPHTILLGYCEDVTLRGLTIHESANYAFLIFGCDKVRVEDATFEGGWDGVHFRGWPEKWNRDLRITGCRFYTGDDSIAGNYVEDAVIERCVINSSCNGVRLIGPARRLAFTHCEFFGPGKFPHRTSDRTNMLAALCLQPSAWGKAEGPMEDVSARDCTMRDIACAFHITTKPGNTAQRLTFERIKATGIYRAAASVESWAERTFRDVVFRDVSLEYTGGGTAEDAAQPVRPPRFDARPLPAWGFYHRNTEDILLERVTLTLRAPDARPALRSDDAQRRCAITEAHRILRAQVNINGSEMTRRQFIAATTALASSACGVDGPPVFAQRGYYLCLMRMPTFGLAVWREILDCAAEDGANTVILWMGGAFRSLKFPITWQWAKEHENVKADFVRELIAHAHRRGIKVLLGFTPFGYDGVNQLPLEKPELKAVSKDGKPVAEFGIGCWGWNLCPAQAESQRFMREYAREMAFEFYPEADGLFIESSDYAICHCAECGPKFFDHEFAFVRSISDEVWARRPDATVVVYPHYFSGAKLRFSFDEAAASKQPFDPRWTLFFTPHSAALEPALIARARGAWWWNEAPSRLDVANIRAGVKQARDGKCSGYVPSLECYSYVPVKDEFGEPWLTGRRQIPFGFGWLKDGANPYRELPVRAIRLVFRELTENPDLPDADLRARLGRELFGADWQPAQVDDLFELFRVFNTDRDWTVPGALTAPGLVRSRAERGKLDAKKRALLREQLAHVRVIAARHRDAASGGAQDLHRIAQWLAGQWTSENTGWLD